MRWVLAGVLVICLIGTVAFSAVDWGRVEADESSEAEVRESVAGSSVSARCEARFQGKSPWVPEDALRCEVDEGGVLRLKFLLRECPEERYGSRFTLAGESEEAGVRVMGRVGDVVAMEGRCAVYEARLGVRQAGTWQLDAVLMWKLRDYDLPPEQLHKLSFLKEHVHQIEEGDTSYMQGISNQTLEYLHSYRRHLLPPGFSVVISVSDDQRSRDPVPFCDELDTTKWGAAEWKLNHSSVETKRVPFRYQNCVLRDFTADEICNLMPNLRLRGAGDSNWQNTYETGWLALLCPGEVSADVFGRGGHCKKRRTCEFEWRFYRGVNKNPYTRSGDYDGISVNIFEGKEIACKQLLGVGIANVSSVQVLTTWNFAKTVKSQRMHMIQRMKWLVKECRRQYPEEMARMTLLMTETTAASTPTGLVKQAWRHIRNGLIQEELQEAQRQLVPEYFDGVVPLFEPTYNWMTAPAQDKVGDIHFSAKFYHWTSQVHASAALATMRLNGKLPKAALPAGKEPWFLKLTRENQAEY